MYNYNALSNLIDSYGILARYDEVCKRLLSEKQVLARILKACAPEFTECDVGDIEKKYIEGEPEISSIAVDRDTEFIEGMNTVDDSITDGNVAFDIRFYAVSPTDGGFIRLIINVEAQNEFYPGYPLVKRGIYYGSRMISAQHGTVFDKQHYEKIEKVYSIWICPDPPVKRRNSICEYSFVENVRVGYSDEKKENYDLITIMFICLGGPGEENYDGVIKMLDVLLSDKIESKEKKTVLKEEYEILMNEDIESEAMDMCNLSQGVVDRTTVEYVINIHEKTGRSIEECLCLIGAPEDRYDVYIRKVEEKLGLQPV